MNEEEFLKLIDPDRTSANMVLHEMMRVVWRLEGRVEELESTVSITNGGATSPALSGGSI
jgi:hypothetical protein